MVQGCKGHIAFVAGYEYFVVLENGLYRSRIDTTYIMPSGYRSGARWQCPESMIDAYMADIYLMKISKKEQTP